MSYATDMSLEDLVIQAEGRAALAQCPPCGICQSDFSSRRATTFCGDCGVELCPECAHKFAMETYCPFCVEHARKVAAYPEANKL